MSERWPIQYAAAALAGSAFVAVTQILAGATLDLPLYVALTLFAANIPFQVILFFMPLPFSIDDLPAGSRAIPEVQKASLHQKVYAWIGGSLVLIKNLFIIGAGFTDTDDLIAMQEGRDVQLHALF